MARNHKQQQTRAAHGLAAPRKLDLCRICGHLVQRTEQDHLFRRVNDPDYTITVCVSCHRKISALDNATDRHLHTDSQLAAPFICVLHRMQVAFRERGMNQQVVNLRDMESSILRTDDYYGPRNYGQKRKSGNGVDDTDTLVLLTDIAMWSRRAGEIVLSRLIAEGQDSFGRDFTSLVALTEDVIRDPRQFYESMFAYLASPDGNTLSFKAERLIRLIQNRNSAMEIHDSWHELTTELSNVSGKVTR